MALSNIFQKQVIMRRVCYAITPLFIYAIFLYGIAPIYQIAVSFITGIFTEYFFEKGRNKKTSEAVLVTCYLYGLSLPPQLPIWMNIVGIFFAVFIGKCVFGGFGRNVYNPAITGRLFIYLAFPIALTTAYFVNISQPAISFAGVFGSVDAVTSATPLVMLAKDVSQHPSLLQLFFGTRSGSMGESSIFLLIIAGIYLIKTKTADWRLMVSTLLSGVVLLALCYFMGIMPGVSNVSASEGITVILAHLMSGSFMYVVVFMTTDPISAPNNKTSKWVYGIIIGVSSMLIRLFGGFPEGVSFGVMIGNTFACLLDEILTKKKVASKKPAVKPADGTSTAKVTATSMVINEINSKETNKT